MDAVDMQKMNEKQEKEIIVHVKERRQAFQAEEDALTSPPDFHRMF